MNSKRLLKRPFGGAGSRWPEAKNLAAVYLFDEGSGTTANDTSGNGLHGTCTGVSPPTLGATGASFDGSGYISVPGGGALDISGTNMTIAVAVDSDVQTAMIFGGYESGGAFPGYGMRLNSGDLECVTDGGGWDNAGADSLHGSWHVLIGVLNSGTWSWYVDGSPYGTPVAGASIAEWNGTRAIGAASNGISIPLTGVIGVLNIWTVPLTATQALRVHSEYVKEMAGRGVTLPGP